MAYRRASPAIPSVDRLLAGLPAEVIRISGFRWVQEKTSTRTQELVGIQRFWLGQTGVPRPYHLEST